LPNRGNENGGNGNGSGQAEAVLIDLDQSVGAASRQANPAQRISILDEPIENNTQGTDSTHPPTLL